MYEFLCYMRIIINLIFQPWNFTPTDVWIILNVTVQNQFQNANKNEMISVKMTNSIWCSERKTTDDM